MILPDINILIHAYNSGYRRHALAKAWWEGKLRGAQGVAMAWIVLLGFVRITTNARILKNPFTPKEALDTVRSWLDLPHITVVHPSSRHFQLFETLIDRAGTAGNLTTDAHLAALAIERGLVLHTTDADFARFPGLSWVNPLD